MSEPSDGLRYRIAMCQFDIPPGGQGGVAHQVARLATVLQARGHDVIMHTTEPQGSQPFRIDKLAVPQATTKHRALRIVSAPLAFALASYRGQDIIHCHGNSELVWRRCTPVVRTFYGTARQESLHAVTWKRRVSQRALASMESIAKARATVTVGISHSAEAVLGTLDFIIPCGVDRTAYRPGPKSLEPSVLFVGTVGGRKRGRLLLDTFSSTIRSVVPDAELWMVASDGPAERREGVRWYTKIADDELRSLYQHAWVLCLPSTYEGFGVPYIEAMASGTAVVATANAGAEEILDGTQGGIIVSDDMLAEGLTRVLTDPDTRRTMEKHGRLDSSKYSWDFVASRYEAAYGAALLRHGEHMKALNGVLRMGPLPCRRAPSRRAQNIDVTAHRQYPRSE